MRLLFLLFLATFIHAQTTLVNEQFNDFRNRNLDAKSAYYFIFDQTDDIADELTGSVTLKDQGSPVLGSNSPIYFGSQAITFDAANDYYVVSPQAPSNSIYALKIVLKNDNIISAAASLNYIIDPNVSAYFVSGVATVVITNEILTMSDGGGNYSYYAHATNTIPAAYHIFIVQWDGTKYQWWVDGIEVATSTSGTPAVITMSNRFTVGARDDGQLATKFDGDIAEVKIYDSQLTDVDVNNEFYCPTGWTGNGKLTRTADWEFSAGLANDGQIAYPIGAKASGVFQITYQDSVAGGSWTSRDTSITMSTVSTDSLYFLESANALVAKIGLTTFQSNDLGASTVYVDNVVLTYTATDDIQDKGFKEHSRTTRKTRKTR